MGKFSFWGFILVVSFQAGLLAQEKGIMLSTYYSSNQYGGATQNWAITQDKRGVLYFGNGFGVLEFDGERWRLIEVPNRSTVRSLEIDAHGRVYVGAYNEFGYLCPDSSGELRYRSLVHLLDSQYRHFEQVWEVMAFHDTVFFQADRYIFRYVNGTLKVWDNKHGDYYLGFKINRKLYLNQRGKGLLLWHNDHFVQVKGGDFFSPYRIHAVIPVGKRLLVCTRENGLYLLSPHTGAVRSFVDLPGNAPQIDSYFRKYSCYHAVALDSGRIAISSISGELLIVDTLWNITDIVDYRTKGIKSPNYYLFYAYDNTLWLALDNGICNVEVNSAYRYWNETLGVNGVLTDVARRGGYTYLSTGTGIFYAPITDNDPCQLSRFNRISGDFEQAWEFLYFDITGQNRNIVNLSESPPASEYRLLVATRNGVFDISKGSSKRISRCNVAYCLAQGKSNPNTLWIGYDKGVWVVEYRNGRWIDIGPLDGVNALVIDLGEDTGGNLWVKPSYGNLLRIANPHQPKHVRITRYDTTMGLPDMHVSILDYYQPVWFYTGNRVYIFDESTGRFTRFFPAPRSGNRRYSDTISYRRLNSEFITQTYVEYLSDKAYWIAADKGIFRYRPTSRVFPELPPVIISSVVNIDSIVYFGSGVSFCPSDSLAPFGKSDSNGVMLKSVFPYSRNSLVFTYSWPYFEGNEYNSYSYRLVGYDSHWSSWSDQTKKEYTNLNEGNYTFRVKARSVYGFESPVAEYRFTVLPPWYRTYWAYAVYLFLALVIIYVSIRLYSRKLIREKDRLEALVRERTQEILIQKEELMVQAEHLKEANAWIIKKNGELEWQKKEIERQKSRLEEANATLKKFFRIIAHDLRNPISILVNSTDYFISNRASVSRERVISYFTELNRLAVNTYNLLENLLDWSKNQMGNMLIKPVRINLRSIVNENIELIQNGLKQKQLSLVNRIDPSVYVVADENMLNTVIRNLLSNAVKFSKEKGKILLYGVVQDSHYSLTVEDNGIGMEPSVLENLFDAHSDTVREGTRRERGSGLGLVLCKEFIEKMRGAITVESEPGKGSSFTITLPVDFDK